MGRRVAWLVALALIAGGCGGGKATDRAVVTTGQVANGPVATRPGEYSRRHTRRSTATVPILMYHVIGTPRASVRYPGLWVDESTFASQVHALKSAGYTAVTLDRVLDAWSGEATLPKRPIVLSFDDGYMGQGTLAGPVLKQAGWPGVLNLALRDLNSPGGLTAGRIRTMIADGWEIDAHSLTHPDLTTLADKDLANEIEGSRKLVHQWFGVPVNSFCYPAGKFNARVEAAVHAAGYRAATTELTAAAKPGDDRLALPRIRVQHNETAGQLVAQTAALR